MSEEIVFGPVPSRRLGMSLGVNNVFSKYCTYSCVYCQVGRTDHLEIERRRFYDPRKIAEEAVKAYRERNPDVVTFVPNGEPTLDINLGVEAKLIKEMEDLRLAILTNSSLFFMEDVRNDVSHFDIVSLKVDTTNYETWKKINRPHPKLDLNEILDSLITFSKEFKGTLITETMLVSGINDKEDEYGGIAKFLKKLRNLNKAYIMVPVRPPAESWVKPPNEDAVLKAYSIFVEELGTNRVELLVAPEPSTFKFKGDLEKEIVKTIHVHPLRLSYVVELAEKKGIDPNKVISDLVKSGEVKLIEYEGEKFLVPKIRK